MKNNDLPAHRKHFYYLRDVYGLPRVTICIVHFPEEDVTCRGVSICSMSENPIKKEGNRLSAERALIAYKAKRNLKPVARDEALLSVELLEDSSFLTLPDYDKMYNETDRMVKCCYMPKLTDYEMTLLSHPTEITRKPRNT